MSEPRPFSDLITRLEYLKRGLEAEGWPSDNPEAVHHAIEALATVRERDLRIAELEKQVAALRGKAHEAHACVASLDVLIDAGVQGGLAVQALNALSDALNETAAREPERAP